MKKTQETTAMQTEWTDETESKESKDIPVRNEAIHIWPQVQTTDVITTDTICLPTGKVTRGFGWQEESGIWRYHSGVDIAYAQGDTVCAVMGGVIQRAERTVDGYVVEVLHGGELWRYEPLSELRVAIGEQIEAGRVLENVQTDRVLHIGRNYNNEWIEPIKMQ